MIDTRHKQQSVHLIADEETVAGFVLEFTPPMTLTMRPLSASLPFVRPLHNDVPPEATRE